MPAMTRSPSCRPFPSRVLAVCCLLVVGTVSVLSAYSSINFAPFFGVLPPAAAATIACTLGIGSLFALQKRFGFCVIGADTGSRGWIAAATAALPFMAIVTSIDLLIGFPANIHVSLPAALVFYPLMGFIAQFALHIVPFTLLLWIITRACVAWAPHRRIWLAIISSACVEAVFQAGASAAPGNDAALATGVVATQVFAFGVTELYLFQRFDFITMYVFRLTYYSYWHVIWGNLLRTST